MQKKMQPVRKIGPGQNSLRGKVQSKKNGTSHDFESALERDYLQLIEFDYSVSRYIEQPIEIIYEIDGVTRHYTPDILVFYDGKRPAELVEIKYRDKLKENWQEYKPKFKAAVAYAESKGWKFRIITEREIRSAYLENVKFLLPYRNTQQINPSDAGILLKVLQTLDVTTPQELIVASAKDKWKQAELLYCLWHLVSTNGVGIDLSNKITMTTEIWAK